MSVLKIKRAAAKSLEKVKKARKHSEEAKKKQEDDALIKLVAKQKASEERRKELEAARLNKVETARQRNIEKLRKLALNSKETELAKTESKVENRLANSHKVMQKNRVNLSQEIEMKHEIQKLKSEDVKYNSRKQQLISVISD